VLWTVILINAVMFVTEIVAGHLARSQALQADALDFLGDTVTYGLSLAVIGASLRTRATAALFKGVSLSVMGAWVLGSTVYHVLVLGLPRAEIMGVIGLLALAANVTSVLLLMRYKDGDANVRSVWLCSRNDAIGNIVVTGAAGAVWLTASAWPDLIVAALMAGCSCLRRCRSCARPGRSIAAPMRLFRLRPRSQRKRPGIARPSSFQGESLTSRPSPARSPRRSGGGLPRRRPSG
jgi:Co/Zn/Cd efflux system component